MGAMLPLNIAAAWYAGGDSQICIAMCVYLIVLYGKKSTRYKNSRRKENIMNILIVSKCPTHPTTAGNRYGILAQAEKLKSMGNDVHFLFVYEPALHKNLRGDALNDIKATKEYWGDHYHQFTVGSIQKYKMIFLKYFRKYFCNMHYKVDDEYPYGVEKLVNKLDGQCHFDICIVNYYYMSRLFEYINIPKTAIFTHDCFAYKNIKIGQQVLCTTADTEAKAMQRCKHIFAVQDIEAAYFQILSPKSKVYNIYGAYSYHPQKSAVITISFFSQEVTRITNMG